MKKRKLKKKRSTIVLVVLISIVLSATLYLLNHDNGGTENESYSGITEETVDSDDNIVEQYTYAEHLSELKNNSENSIEVNEEGLSHREYLEDKAEQILNNMTLYEKVCQMFVVTPEQLTGIGQVTASGIATKNSLRKIPVGGIIYMQANLQTPDQTKEMLSNVQDYAMEIEGVPLFLCIDEEGGRVARIGGNASFGIEKPLPMADITSIDEAHNTGEFIGRYLSEIGFNVDFAPVCDVLSNPDNQVIGDRSFGTDAEMVKKYAREFSNGLHESGILSTYKHFPGHGATADDTHKGMAFTDKSIDELLETELIPFADAEDSEVDMVMVSHISVPMILGEDIPCSLSYYMVTNVLKDRLGYKGIVITDAMNMGAIANNYNSDEAIVMAIKAGNDMILAPVNLETAINIVVENVNSDEIDEDRIDNSVRKIIMRKLNIN